MRLKKLIIFIVLTALVLSLTACSTSLNKDEASSALRSALDSSFAADSAYINIKERMTFQQKNVDGTPKVDKNGNPVTKTELVTTVKVQTYITSDKKYVNGSRLTYIEEISYDEFGAATSVCYWAGTPSSDKTTYLIKKEYVNGKETYYRQVIPTDDIFTFAEFKQFEKKTLLASWYTLEDDDYTFKSARKEGKVTYIDIDVKPEHDKKLADLGTLTVRLTNDKLTSMQANTINKTFFFEDITTNYQIDYMLAGAYINLPDIDSIKNNKNIDFIDNAEIVA